MVKSMSAPFVVVWMVTYNHEKYIEKSVESVMMQTTNFKYKLYIGEDCSSDETLKLCKVLKNKYSEKMELFFDNLNIGSVNNARKIYKLCYESGAKYVAFLEGDDYWTDNLKLQKQFDFMEKNNSFSCCAHNSNTLYENNSNNKIQLYNSKSKYRDVLHKKDFNKLKNFHTSSLFIRNKYLQNFINFDPILIRDYPLKLFLLNQGPIKIFNDVMSTYRRTNFGLSENISIIENFKTEIKTITALEKVLGSFYFKSLYLKSYWYRYYLINGNNLSLLKKLKLFFKFLIPSFYGFPRNIRDILSSIHNGFLK